MTVDDQETESLLQQQGQQQQQQQQQQYQQPQQQYQQPQQQYQQPQQQQQHQQYPQVTPQYAQNSQFQSEYQYPGPAPKQPAAPTFHSHKEHYAAVDVPAPSVEQAVPNPLPTTVVELPTRRPTRMFHGIFFGIFIVLMIAFWIGWSLYTYTLLSPSFVIFFLCFAAVSLIPLLYLWVQNIVNFFVCPVAVTFDINNNTVTLRYGKLFGCLRGKETVHSLSDVQDWPRVESVSTGLSAAAVNYLYINIANREYRIWLNYTTALGTSGMFFNCCGTDNELANVYEINAILATYRRLTGMPTPELKLVQSFFMRYTPTYGCYANNWI
eukprot:TRINITY_DN716_c0_g1_i1.p1 TRINITY_DN716_c0_g1~~TRINITY_DN716_c0_g1_i1.p1  ORF type:complete len:325 (-),score=96.62 TRINITY_DN716_c0_g1_i1:66-1040(-)